MSLAQLSRLLPLPDDDLKQVIEYAATLSKTEAVEHFMNLLGDSPQVMDFIATFNSRRADPKPEAAAHPSTPAKTLTSDQKSDTDGVPKPQRRAKKKKPPLQAPAPRQVASFALTAGTVYNKKMQEDDYVAGRSGRGTPVNATDMTTGLGERPHTKASSPPPPSSSSASANKPPPSTAGTLVSDLGLAKSKPKSTPSTRSSKAGLGGRNNTTKVSITGGVPMHGASTALADLEQAIRSLELCTNPTLELNSAAGSASRRCNCVATRHPLQTAAPNCLSCGKVICVKEGLGPCTFCGSPLLSPAEVRDMIKELRAERGREKMAADRDAHRKAGVAATPRPFTTPRVDEPGAAEARALEHRDRLLGYQAQNAQRTTVRDEVADFDVSMVANIWASPEERARELKRQQKMLREMEWNTRPEYEKRRQVVSIDLVGGKVVKKMAAVERPTSPEEEAEELFEATMAEASTERDGGVTLARNPLLGGMIKPVYDMKDKAVELDGQRDSGKRWRIVQDDLDDDEAVVPDGGLHGDVSESDMSTGGGDEPVCG